MQVINLGTFATEEEAARVWNEAALLFRGGRRAPQSHWLAPVQTSCLPGRFTRRVLCCVGCGLLLLLCAEPHCCLCCCCPAGADAWLNPVEPKLPEDYTPGELHLASDKAASAVVAAAVAAGLPPPKVVVKSQ